MLVCSFSPDSHALSLTISFSLVLSRSPSLLSSHLSLPHLPLSLSLSVVVNRTRKTPMTSLSLLSLISLHGRKSYQEDTDDTKAGLFTEQCQHRTQHGEDNPDDLRLGRLAIPF